MCIAWPQMDFFPFAAQLIFQRDRRAVRAGQYAAVLIFGVTAEIGVGLQHTAGLSAVLIIRSVVLLCSARRGNDVLRTRQRSDAFQSVPCGIFVVADVFVRQPHQLAGEGMRDVVPDAPDLIVPLLHELPGYGNKLLRQAGRRIADDPVVSVAAFQAAGLQYLLADGRRHRLIRPDVEQIQDIVRYMLTRAVVDHKVRQLRHAVAQDFNAAVDRAQLPCRALHVLSDSQTAGGCKRADCDGFPGSGRPCSGCAEPFNNAHSDSSVPSSSVSS